MIQNTPIENARNTLRSRAPEHVTLINNLENEQVFRLIKVLDYIDGNDELSFEDFITKTNSKRMIAFVDWKRAEEMGLFPEIIQAESILSRIKIPKNGVKLSLIIDIELDFEFWAITPAFNINLHSRNFEFEWLCIGIYIGKKPSKSCQ